MLVVEDDRFVSDTLFYMLQRNRFEVLCASEATQSLDLAREYAPDLIILNWTIKGLSDACACRRLSGSRAKDRPGIIIVTSRASEPDRISGLGSGADDYVTKPFSQRELMARIRVVLRRRPNPLDADTLSYADVEMNVVHRAVHRDGRALSLSPTEFRLLRYFLAHPRQVLSRERLRRAVSPSHRPIQARSINVHVRRLRDALKESGLPDLICTVRAAGYSLQAPSER